MQNNQFTVEELGVIQAIINVASAHGVIQGHDLSGVGYIYDKARMLIAEAQKDQA